MTPPVSVLMPVYNNSAHLRASIDSILAQSHREFELVIIDDGSKDASADIISTYRDSRIRFERFEQNRGLSAALNRGLELATAPLVARQDADDISRADRLSIQLACFARQPELVMAGSQARMLSDQGAVIGTVNRPLDAVSIRWYSIVDSAFIHSSVMLRRSVVLECGGYDGAFDPYTQDFELWWRMIQRGPVFNLADRLLDYRVNAGSITAKTHQPKEAAYRAGFNRMITEGISRHALESFGDRGLTAEDARLLGGFAAGVDAATLSRFLDVFAGILSWFEQAHPEAVTSADFRSTVARQYDAIAYRVTPPSRGAAARVYAHAMRRRPSLAGRLSWPRMLATLIFGLGGRARLAKSWRGA